MRPCIFVLGDIGNGGVQGARTWYQQPNFRAGGGTFTRENALVADYFYLDGRLLFVGAVHGEFNRDLVSDRESHQLNGLVGMFASFIEREQGRPDVRQRDAAGVFQRDEGIGHFAHAMQNINAGVAPQDLNGDGWTGG